MNHYDYDTSYHSYHRHSLCSSPLQHLHCDGQHHPIRGITLSRKEEKNKNGGADSCWYELSIEAPGTRKKDIHITIAPEADFGSAGDLLRLSIEWKRTIPYEVEHVRRLLLPEKLINPDEAKVRYKDGLILIRLPLKPAAVPRELKITS